MFFPVKLGSSLPSTSLRLIAIPQTKKLHLFSSLQQLMGLRFTNFSQQIDIILMGNWLKIPRHECFGHFLGEDIPKIQPTTLKGEFPRRELVQNAPKTFQRFSTCLAESAIWATTSDNFFLQKMTFKSSEKTAGAAQNYGTLEAACHWYGVKIPFKPINVWHMSVHIIYTCWWCC